MRCATTEMPTDQAPADQALADQAPNDPLTHECDPERG